MGKFFSRVSTKGEAPQIGSFSNMMNFYSLLLFLIAIPFILIVALVWLTGILGFSTWIIAGLAVLMALGFWRLYRKWGQIKAKMAAQGSEFKDIVAEAAKDGKDVEVSLLNGLLTFRYHGNRYPTPVALPYRSSEPLALEAPSSVAIDASTLPDDGAALALGQLRRELEGYIRLRDSGVISCEEFDQIRNRLMDSLNDNSASAKATEV
ncbi:MAG: hypothetical protein ACLFUU_05165 [Desulfobacteraceae bacterium]